MDTSADPDVFARKRLWQRVCIIIISQLVSSLSAAYQIYGAASASFEVQDLGSSISLSNPKFRECLIKKCCSQQQLNKLMLEKDGIKSEGLLAFVLVFSLSMSSMIICIVNYVAFIKYRNPYLRKIVINVNCLIAFITQVVSCTTFYNGLQDQQERSRKYCVGKVQMTGIENLRECLSVVSLCPNFNLLYGLWSMIIFTTILIPVVIMYSCKWREKVFSRLADNLAFRRKAVLHSLQRSMLQGVKLDLEADLDFERKTLQQLEVSILEEYEMLKSFEETFKKSHRIVGSNADSTARKVLNYEFHCYLEKLAEYNQQLASIMNKAEALQELRKMDLDMLKHYANYVNQLQKLRVPESRVEASTPVAQVQENQDTDQSKQVQLLDEENQNSDNNNRP